MNITELCNLDKPVYVYLSILIFYTHSYDMYSMSNKQIVKLLIVCNMKPNLTI